MSQKLMDSSRGMETGQEGANGQELHHFLHQYNQQSPGLQGGLPLALSPQSQQAAIAGVKREPEDLSSSRAPAKRHKQNQQPDSPTPPGLYHHHPHQIQVRQLFFFSTVSSEDYLKKNSWFFFCCSTPARTRTRTAR